MPKRIEFEGKVHEFPDDFTDADIGGALKQIGAPQQRPQPASPSPEPRSVGGFAKNVLTSTGKLIGDTVDAVVHPIRTVENIGAIPVGLYEKAGGPVPASWGKSSERQLDAMLDHFKQRYGSIEGAKEALYSDPAGVVADASIFIGGAGAAARGGAGLAKAGGLTRTAGALSAAADIAGAVNPANVIGNAASGAMRTAKSTAGAALKRSAVEQYSQALKPTTAPAKATAQQVAPRMLDEGMRGTLENIKGKAEMKKEFAGQGIDDFMSDPVNAQRPMRMQPVLDAIGKARERFVSDGPNGPVVVNKAAAGALDAVSDTIQKHGRIVSLETIRKVRQIFDEMADHPRQKAKEYRGQLNLDAKASYAADAAKEAADAIRSEISKAEPDLAKLNAEYSTWKSVEDVVKATISRKTGQDPLGPKIARVGGAMIGGGGAKGMITGQAMKWVAEVVDGPYWNTTSAVMKNKLANAMINGDLPLIRQTTKAIASGGVTGARLQLRNPAKERELREQMDREMGIPEITEERRRPVIASR